MKRAQSAAVRDARRAAFAKMIIIQLSNGKTFVRFQDEPTRTSADPTMKVEEASVKEEVKLEHILEDLPRQVKVKVEETF